ncbi:MAG TPA: phosphoribosylglycinamide formyltransferase [Thermoplasmata archaeon]|nr:phosphoribosylglycinamide formyltransferase [Thermoplasmata archaeon]
MARALSIGVLVSGEGTLLDALSQRIGEGTVPARIALVVSDRPRAGALERARRAGLPTESLPRAGVPPERWSSALDSLLRGRAVDVVVLAGFLSILPSSFLERWTGRVLNVHPSLLPNFGGKGMFGLRVHRAVLESGERTTGATVHLVTESIDAGPVLAQRSMPVEVGDTPESLRDRLRPVEVELLAEVLGRFARGEAPRPEERRVGAG